MPYCWEARSEGHVKLGQRDCLHGVDGRKWGLVSGKPVDSLKLEVGAWEDRGEGQCYLLVGVTRGHW